MGRCPNERYHNCLPAGYLNWTDQQLKRIRYYLIEFVVNYKSTKGAGEVMPSTMKRYITGLQRAFESEWGYVLRIFEGQIFNCRKEGLLSVIDNKFSLQQSEGEVVKSHNTLSKEDLHLLFSSDLLSRSTPDGYQPRLIFEMGLITAMRPTALAYLTLRQVKKLSVKGEEVWSISSVIGSRIRDSKVSSGGLAAVRERPTEVCLWNRDAFDGSVNVFNDVNDYMAVRSGMDCRTDRFFLGVNRKGKTLQSFFRKQPLGRNSFGRIIKTVCEKLGLVGSGMGDCVAHGLRRTVVTMLFEANMANATVAMRTGHRDMRSLKSYHNLRGNLIQEQQDAIFGTPLKKRKHEEDVNDDKENNGGKVDATFKNDDDGVDDSTAAGKMATETEKQTKDTGENYFKSRADALLSGISAISGGNFTFNVHNHYR